MAGKDGYGKEGKQPSQEKGSKKSISVVGVRVVREMNFKFNTTKVDRPETAAKIAMSFLEGADREHFIILILNTKTRVNGIHVVSIGTLDSSLVHPREVFKAALLSNAAAIILAHNHPSGDPTPSKEDIQISKRLVEVGSLLGIKVLDHIVTGLDCYVSMKNEGLIE